MPSSLSIQSIFGDALEISDARARATFLDEMCAGNVTLRNEIEELLKAETDAGSDRFMADPAASSGVVNALAHDFERHLNGEPLEVRTRSAGNRINAYVTKHRAALLAIAGLIGILILAGAIRNSLAQRARTMEAKVLAEAAEAGSRKQSETALQLWRSLMHELSAWDTPFPTDVEVRAGVREYVAASRDKTDNFAKSIPIVERSVDNFRRALGDDHPETLRAKSMLATLYFNVGQFEKSQPLLERALEKQKSILGVAHEDTLSSMAGLAFVYAESGQHAKAIPLDEFVAQNTTQPDLRILALSDLANAWLISGFPEKAIPAAERAVEKSQAAFGPGDARTAPEIAILSRASLRTGQIERALAMCSDAMEKFRRSYGPDHRATLSAMAQLGAAYAQSQQLDKAIPLLEETFSSQKRVIGPEHPSTLVTMQNLSSAYAADRRFGEAESLLKHALDLQTRKFGERHYMTLGMVDALIAIDMDTKRFDRAASLAESAVPNTTLTYGEFHAETLKIRHILALATARGGQVAKAVPLFESLVRDCSSHLGPEAPETLRAMYDSNQTLAQSGEHERAEKGSRELLTLQLKIFGENPEVAAPTLEQLSVSLLARKRPADAEPFLRQALAIRQKYGPDQWQTFHTQVQFGTCLLDQQKFAEGEPVLRAGYEGLKLRTNPTSAYETGVLTEAKNQLIACYRALGQPAKADALKR